MFKQKYLVLILLLFLAGCSKQAGNETAISGEQSNQNQKASTSSQEPVLSSKDYEYPADWPGLAISNDGKRLQWLRGDANYTGQAGGRVGNSNFGMSEGHIDLLPVNEVKPEAIIQFAADEVSGLNKPEMELQKLNKDNTFSVYPLQQQSMTAPKEAGDYTFILSVDWGNGDNNILYWFTIKVKTNAVYKEGPGPSL